MGVIQKIRRELVKPLSKLCLRSARVKYFGFDLRVPLIYGIGAGYLSPGDGWMRNCLSVFLKNKKGAIVDIGANIGVYLVKLKSLEPEREYYGFEPNPMCNYYTHELITANKFKNVRMFPFALSNKKEMRTFYAKRKADKMGSLHDYARPGEVKGNSFDLLTFPGDDFFELLRLEDICSIKIDVEGFELEVLEGIKKTLATYRPFVYCEIWEMPEKTNPMYEEKYRRRDSICKLLATIDYDMFGFTGDQQTLIAIKTVSDFANDQRSDYLLAHASDREKIVKLFGK